MLGSREQFVVKVQRSLLPIGELLIYSQSEHVLLQAHESAMPDLLAKMDGRHKAYFLAHLIPDGSGGNLLEFLGDVPSQDW